MKNLFKMVKDLLKILVITIPVFAILFAIQWFRSMKYHSPDNPNYITSIKDEKGNVFAVFDENSVLNFNISKSKKDSLEKLNLYNSHPTIPLTSKELPSNYIYFLTNIENKNFFSFGIDNIHGFSISAYLRLLNGSFNGGGSNIQQQTLKNIVNQGVTKQYFSRKIGEQFAGFQLDKTLSKEEILTEYTNYAGKFWFEKGYSGITMATYDIFNKAPNQLNDLEMLATVRTLNGNKSYFYKDNKLRDKEEIKKKLLQFFEALVKREKNKDSLKVMQTKLEEMRKMNLHFSKGKKNYLKSKTSLYNFFNKSLLKDYKNSKVQYITSITKKNQDNLKKAVGKFKKRYKSQLHKNGFDLQISVICVDVKTGLIEANYGNINNSGVSPNFTNYGTGFETASIMKPLYFLELFENYNFNKYTKLFNGNINNLYYNPDNYGSMYLNDTVTVKDVFQYSFNKAAVNHRLYVNNIEVANSVESKLLEMGIPPDNQYTIKGDYILGGRRLTPFQIAAFYQMILNNGAFKELSPWKHLISSYSKDTIKSNITRKGKTIYSFEKANEVKSLLTSAFENEGTTHHLLKILPKDKLFYGKTGTGTGSKNGWVIISDGDKLIVVWVGYMKNSNGKLTSKDAPKIIGRTGGQSAGILGALSYKYLYE